MVTGFDERALVPLFRVAVKVTDLPTAGVVVDGLRVSAVDCAAAVGTATTPANTMVMRRITIETEAILYKRMIAC